MHLHNPTQLTALSDALIGASYFAIPAALGSSAAARHRLFGKTLTEPGGLLLILFAAFIFSCGIGHWIDAWFLFRGQCSGVEDVKVAWNWVTATISVLTMIVLVPVASRYIALLYKQVDEAQLALTIQLLKERLERAQKP